MSRARTCGAAGASTGDQGAASRASVTKAADDSFSRSVRPNHQSKRSRSRNKIPKSIRYELENSLVGLCDVWFEEIKPHLVRNNIKLHVHDADVSPGASPSAGAAAGAGAAGCAIADAGCASGDHQQRQALPMTPRCSHLDPASSAQGCKLCRLLFNAANSIQSAVSQATNAGSPPRPTVTGVNSADSSRLRSDAAS